MTNVNPHTRTTFSWNVSAVRSTCHPRCRIWSMLWWRLRRPLRITWFWAKDGTSSWRRASTSTCPSCCRREDTPVTLCEESLQGLGSFWSRYAGRVRQNVNINQQESVAWKINTLKTGVTSFSSGLCSLTSQPTSKGDWTVYFNEPTSSAESSYLVSINTDLLKYNSNKYSTFGVFFPISFNRQRKESQRSWPSLWTSLWTVAWGSASWLPRWLPQCLSPILMCSLTGTAQTWNVSAERLS